MFRRELHLDAGLLTPGQQVAYLMGMQSSLDGYGIDLRTGRATAKLDSVEAAKAYRAGLKANAK